jgi:anti-anti-sigma factor
MHGLVPLVLPSAGSIDLANQDGVLVLQLVGEVDAEIVAAYERDSSPVTERPTAVDLTGVTFLSSSAVSFLIRRTQPVRDRGKLPAIRGISAPARRVLEMVGVIGLFAAAT